MRVIKIVKDPNGKVGIQIKGHEKYDIGEHLEALTEFISEEAVRSHNLQESHERLLTRLGECEKKLSELSQKIEVI
jgi:hypothetical protein